MPKKKVKKIIGSVTPPAIFSSTQARGSSSGSAPDKQF
jgi:hypothetical protein